MPKRPFVSSSVGIKALGQKLVDGTATTEDKKRLIELLKK
jgi:hypothetical protein